jgi:hypothetical protein
MQATRLPLQYKQKRPAEAGRKRFELIKQNEPASLFRKLLVMGPSQSLLLSEHQSAAGLWYWDTILLGRLNPQVSGGFRLRDRLALRAAVSHATGQFRDIDYEYLICFIPENDHLVS